MTTKSVQKTYSRQTIASSLVGLGVLVLLSGLLINPWLGRFYHPVFINYQDVLLKYFITSIVICALIMGCALLLLVSSWKIVEGFSVLLVMCGLMVLADRFLLAWVGLPLWMADPAIHYKHRPNVVRSWGPTYENKLIRINKYGQHDTDFPIDKPGGEIRGLAIGDSITMGHGVTAEETFANQLEKMLAERNGKHHTYQIINAGVQGYATYHEYGALIDSLKFKPDFIIVQFCLNDLTEPFIFDKQYGGSKANISRIAQNPSFIANYFLNETGCGRVIQKIEHSHKSVEGERQWELYNTEKAAASAVDDPTFSKGWELTLQYLDKIDDVAKTNNARIVLLICPHTFQIVDDTLRKPQEILTVHAATQNIDVIDLTTVFEKLILDRPSVTTLRAEGFSNDQIKKYYDEKFLKYFLDNDHFTVEGHRVVASELYSYVVRSYSL